MRNKMVSFVLLLLLLLASHCAVTFSEGITENRFLCVIRKGWKCGGSEGYLYKGKAHDDLVQDNEIQFINRSQPVIHSSLRYY